MSTLTVARMAGGGIIREMSAGLAIHGKIGESVARELLYLLRIAEGTSIESKIRCLMDDSETTGKILDVLYGDKPCPSFWHLQALTATYS
jgi:hypothetical protein